MARMSRGDTIASIEDGNAGTARCAENVPSRLAVASSNATRVKRYGRVDVGGATAREIPTAHDDRRALFQRVERTPRAQTLPRQRGLQAVRADFAPPSYRIQPQEGRGSHGCADDLHSDSSPLRPPARSISNPCHSAEAA